MVFILGRGERGIVFDMFEKNSKIFQKYLQNSVRQGGMELFFHPEVVVFRGKVSFRSKYDQTEMYLEKIRRKIPRSDE